MAEKTEPEKRIIRFFIPLQVIDVEVSNIEAGVADIAATMAYRAMLKKLRYEVGTVPDGEAKKEAS